MNQSSERRSTVRLLLRALRPHQWVKNLLVFVPAVAAHTVLEPGVWTASLLTFAVFCLCASAIYILNDISDIQPDRLHPRKRFRPFATGDLSIGTGITAAAALLLAAGGIAWAGLPGPVGVVIVVYVALSTSYSLVLKSRAVADVLALTGLYILRIVAGGVATATPLSSWFLAFALFFFSSLAFVKRYTELVAINGPLAGRGYGPGDASWIRAIGIGSGYMAVVILALYISAPDVTALYSRPLLLWILCPVLLVWLTRLWLRASRGLVHDDPIVEALRDTVSYVTAAVAAVVLVAAI
jgi:4-hydroxybenzoate polyprenyltransferase